MFWHPERKAMHVWRFQWQPNDTIDWGFLCPNDLLSCFNAKVSRGNESVCNDFLSILNIAKNLTKCTNPKVNFVWLYKLIHQKVVGKEVRWTLAGFTRYGHILMDDYANSFFAQLLQGQPSKGVSLRGNHQKRK